MSFFWGECQSAGGTVPDDQIILISPQRVAMRGSESKPVRCMALLGDVGSGVRCTLYEQRASPCREFEASWASGEHNLRCDDARRAHGLPPLEPPLQPEVAPQRVA